MAPFIVLGGIAAVTAVCLWLNVAPHRPAVFAPIQSEADVLSRPDPPQPRAMPSVQDVPLPSAIAPPLRPVQAHHVMPGHKSHPIPRG